MMVTIFQVIELHLEDKIGELITTNKSKVQSTKSFPIYQINGKKMIFKPLSKTKPLTTPFFAYSEVFWSYVIKTYFDENTPSYFLAISDKENQPKYFKQGVLVESLTPNDETLINLYDFFMTYKDSNVQIENYVNYCLCQYDYTKILKSEQLQKNPEIGEKIAFQILLSILRQDQNFHYENINLYEDFSVAPPIDFEFSTPFLYPDHEEAYQKYAQSYLKSLTIPYEDDTNSLILKALCANTDFQFASTQMLNVCQILKLYPNVVLEFIKKLEKFIKDIPFISLQNNNEYIGPLNSDYWMVFHALYKEENIPSYEKLNKEIKLQQVNKGDIFHRIMSNILTFSNQFLLSLKILYASYESGITDLENLTIREFLNKMGITASLTIQDIDLTTKQLKLKRK